MSDLPRVGRIPYLNCLPLRVGLDATGGGAGLEFVDDTPARLAQRLLQGELDAAPVSSIEYLRNIDELVVLPDLAITSHGPVGSVQLASHVQPSWIDGRVVMTDASATSHALLAILLRELWASEALLTVGEVDLPSSLDDASAALLIGDPALHAALRPVPGVQLTDLGAAWDELTGKPMTYALWAARRAFAADEPDLLDGLAHRLRGGMAWGLDNLDSVTAFAADQSTLPVAEMTRYYAGLDYQFGPQARAGLAEFAARAHAHGLLQTLPDLELATESAWAA
jgi:chorismate dehydratase